MEGVGVCLGEGTLEAAAHPGAKMELASHSTVGHTMTAGSPLGICPSCSVACFGAAFSWHLCILFHSTFPAQSILTLTLQTILP